MSDLIVIRIVPPAPLDPGAFTARLDPAGLGPLQVTAYELTFTDPDVGRELGTATFVPFSTGPSPTSAVFGAPPLTIPGYAPAAPTQGIVQHFDLDIATPPLSAFFQLDAAATAIIEIPSAAKIENLRLVAQWGSGAGAVPVGTPQTFYDVVLSAGPAPDLNTWAPVPSTTVAQIDPWQGLSPSAYVHLPAPPGAGQTLAFALPADGTPPPFDGLLSVVQQVLSLDPGTSPVLATTAASAGGATIVQLPAGTAGISPGMSVSGAGIAPGAAVIAIDAGGQVTLSEETAGPVPTGTSLTFAPDLAGLTADQCRNIAYEIVWSQQDPPPSPKDPVGQLYSNPPNSGSMLDGSQPSNMTPNLLEGARQQLEANLTSYYAVADATADRLTEFVQSLSAAVACERRATGATRAMLELPANGEAAGGGPVHGHDIVLTGIDAADSPTNFGVPAAFFYALAALLPGAIGADQRFKLATGDGIERLLAQLTAAIQAGTVADSETFFDFPAANANAAQAARRLRALDVPTGSTAPLAPLGARCLATIADVPSGATLPFAATGGLVAGMGVSGSAIRPGTTLASVAAAAATLSAPLTADLPSGSEVTFVPVYSASLAALVKAWLSFPATVTGTVSSQTYTAADEATFWTAAAIAEPAACLDLVLSGVTEGTIVPAPENTALGSLIIADLLSAPTLGALAAVTRAQWTAFFATHPIWLPPGIGNLQARTDAFVRKLQRYLVLGGAGPAAPFVLATVDAAPLAATTLGFAASTTIADGMLVTGTGIAAGTTVTAVTTSAGVTMVTLSKPTTAAIPAGANVTFSMDLATGPAPVARQLAGASQDWLGACLTAYGPYTLGSGFDPDQLHSAVATVFDDASARDWAFSALTTLDALYQVMAPVPVPSGATGAFAFSVIEALYARGFTSAQAIGVLSVDTFAQALVGSVAFDLAGAIHASATTIAPPPSATSGVGPFAPINDGTLVDCIAAPSASPLGPVAYLAELLKLTELGTCDAPFATSPDTPTLGAVLTARRGPLGDLLASAANLETPLPLIDIVNENLEFLGAAAMPAGGVIYDTSADALAGHVLCQAEPCPPDPCDPPCHEPAKIFAALPEYSTPATPIAANAAVEPAVWDTLKADFSSCQLPYAQALDVSRTYLAHFGSCRAEEMRTFRKCITEFVLDPASEPIGFQDHLWRYPVRIDIAIEYLGITPEEYATLFDGTKAPSCGQRVRQPVPPRDPAQPVPGEPDPNGRDSQQPAGPAVLQREADGVLQGRTTRMTVPEFLAGTCLSYCEFVELWRSGFVPFRNPAARDGSFPECEPCCLDDVEIVLPIENERERIPPLRKLVVFVRLWRKLQKSCCLCYTFAQLRDICDVLELFVGGAPNPEFVRQFAAFQMLRDRYGIPLSDPSDPPAPGAVDADRTQLLALWVGAGAAKWGWAVRELCARVLHRAHRPFHPPHRADLVEYSLSKLEPLSVLAGFDPTSTTDTWHQLPTHTLRFAEILEKLAASRFTLAEVLYLFTADDQHCGDIFPLQDECEAMELPLAVPADECAFSLWDLRRELLHAHTPWPCGEPELIAVEFDGVIEGDDCGPPIPVHIVELIAEYLPDHWHWHRVSTVLTQELGFKLDDVLALGRHFFPHRLRESGFVFGVADTRFTGALATAQTNPAMWSAAADGPLQYDAGTGTLWTHIPLAGQDLVAQLVRLDQLNATEQGAVQDLVFQPRALLALFAVLFPDFAAAERQLIEARGEHERWEWFRRHVALTHLRCRIIARHLSRHVEAVTGQPCPDGEQVALLILRELYGDENAGVTDWEDDSGTTPAVTWTPKPNGSGFAALLGLVGTGLVGDYKADGGALVWRAITDGLGGFGHLGDRLNMPVPTVLPALDATITPAQSAYVSVRNGYLVKNAGGALLGGAQAFTVTWDGALLVDEEGHYDFWAGAPRPPHEKPDCECDTVENFQWRVTLKRGSRTWVLLAHSWPAEEDRHVAGRHLKRGAYKITVEFVRPAFAFASEHKVHPLHAGFEVKYAGADTGGFPIAIPRRQLFAITKDTPLAAGITTKGAAATAFLERLYTSSLRDIRRTYQRAFKALLFAHRFALGASRDCQGTSELGYMLEEKVRFAGAAYFPSGGGYVQHLADFDFNFLPILDDLDPPTTDHRTKPSAKRTQAMFDWWERTHDYSVARDDVRERHDHAVWHLWAEARANSPVDPAPLLVHLGATPDNRPLERRYLQNQFSPPYAVTGDDLSDDRWTIRAWHADHWLTALERHFTVKDIAVARPDLWASDNPAALVAGETQTGNGNLLEVLTDGCIENGLPPRYEELKTLNDGLRTRGRDALLAYLSNGNRVPLPWLGAGFATTPRELSELLLLDVEAGVCERATRIEDVISAGQAFIQRARLLLEPSWRITPAFMRLWDRQFASFRIWEMCKRRTLYKENWIEWDDLERARGIEAFRLLEDRLRDGALTAPVPGGGEWWPGAHPPAPEPTPLQRIEPSALTRLPALREGLDLLGTPERDARPSWLAAIDSAVRRNPASDGQAGAILGEQPVPLWLESAIRLGTTFVRVAAAGLPPAASPFEPHAPTLDSDCVTCCSTCGCDHPPLVDEYYFWLIAAETYEAPVPVELSGGAGGASDYEDGYQNDYYNTAQQHSAVWQETDKLARLLDWQPKPAVRLAWTRLHNGEFQQPRRSIAALEVDPSTDADLLFLGRTGDSLTFSVAGGLAPEGHIDPAAPGFRFDLADDAAVVLPLLLAPAIAPVFLAPANLPSYPWMLYVSPGAPLFPLSPYSPVLAVAQTLRAHCRFEAALAWYRGSYSPLHQDNTWIDCHPDDDNANDNTGNIQGGTQIVGRHPEASCCDSTAITCDEARDRSILLDYLDTLGDWSDAVRRHAPSAEADSRARTIVESAARILGPVPRTVVLPAPTLVPKIADFVPAFPPLNPRLLDLYATVRDQLESIRACANDRRLRDGTRRIETEYFGNSRLREGWQTVATTCDDETEWCFRRSPYRFGYLIAKAHEYATRVQELGNALLAAYEKGDAEYLAVLRAGHEREVLTLGLESRKNAWRDADWQVEVLQKAKAMAQTNFQYYTDLKANGLIANEIAYEALTVASTILRGSGNAIEAVAGAMSGVGNYFMGVAGFGGTPLIYSQLPLGQPLSGSFASAARVLMGLADISGTTGGLNATLGSWDRRLQEWTHQIDVLTIEIQQIERQTLGAQRRRDLALNDLNTQARQIEQSAEVQDFLRDKFSAHGLYLFLQKETAALHRKSYELALGAALQAQHAFNVERGHTTRSFLPECAWDSLHQGLLSGERLVAAIATMEKAYTDENLREYELTKQISLRLHFPEAFLQLRSNGHCEIEVPEWMFDVDFPGQYMRRIKSVSLTIPCVTGPYAGVHCQLTLLNSTTRIDPRLAPPPHGCCCPQRCCGTCDEARWLAREYVSAPDDPRVVRQFGAREAIATSTGQNDAGLFMLDFNDQRYLPFEYAGAVSRWRIELPPGSNYFATDTLTDCIMRMNYTSSEGGPLLRRAAEAAARGRLPGDGWRLIDVRHELPDAWIWLRERTHCDGARLDLRLERRMFPFLPGCPEIVIGGMAILVGKGCRPDLPAEGCQCPDEPERARIRVEFMTPGNDCPVIPVDCVANPVWPDFYFGSVKTPLGPLGPGNYAVSAELRFPDGVDAVEELFLLCRYAPLLRKCCEIERD